MKYRLQTALAILAFVLAIVSDGIAQGHPSDNITQPIFVTQDGQRNAGGDITYLGNGELLVIYWKGIGGQLDPGKGKIVSKRSYDYGLTWEVESAVFEVAQDIYPHDSYEPQVTRLSNGNVIVSFFKSFPSFEPVMVMTSSDNGSSWGTPVPVSTSFTEYAFTGTRIIELNNGILKIAIGGKNLEDTYRSVHLISSSDNGQTWIYQSTIARGDDYGFNIGQTALVEISDNIIMAFLRTEKPGDIPYKARNSISYDGGNTWSEPVEAYIGIGTPSVLKLSDGRWIVTYRRYKVEGALNRSAYMYPALRVSTDNGTTWSGEVYIDEDSYNECGTYAVELEDGRVATIYFIWREPYVGEITIDVKFRYITGLIDQATRLSTNSDNTDWHLPLTLPDPVRHPVYIPPATPAPSYNVGGGVGGGGVSSETPLQGAIRFIKSTSNPNIYMVSRFVDSYTGISIWRKMTLSELIEVVDETVMTPKRFSDKYGMSESAADATAQRYKDNPRSEEWARLTKKEKGDLFWLANKNDDLFAQLERVINSG